MAEPVYTSRCSITQRGALHRHARLGTGQDFEMGVHGPVMDMYKLSPERPLPLPVDYIVAATGG